jgi:hypothetical protein
MSQPRFRTLPLPTKNDVVQNSFVSWVKLTLKKQPATNSTGPETTAPIGKSDIKRSALETWRKLDTVIQNELALILKGNKEVTASTAAAVIKFIEASASLATGSEDLSAKDAQDRQQCGQPAYLR